MEGVRVLSGTSQVVGEVMSLLVMSLLNVSPVTDSLVLVSDSGSRPRPHWSGDSQ